MSVYSCKSPFENFCSRNVGSFYLVVRVFMSKMYTQLFASSYIWPATDVLYVVGWIISFRQIAVWDSQNVLTFFILIGVFENLTFFSILIFPSIALKPWNIQENFYFKVKTVANFFLMSRFLSICNNISIKQRINHGAIQKLLSTHSIA